MALTDFTTKLNLGKLTTPRDFIVYYYKGLKNDLSSIDLNLSKTGIIGYFLNIIGNVQFDVKNYYDFLFNESLPITALKTENLILHSNLFNFNPDSTIAAKVNGDIAFNFNAIVPNIGSNVHRQELVINELAIIINSIHYLMKGEYQLVSILDSANTHYNYIVNITDFSTGVHSSHPVSSLTKVPLVGFSQITKQSNIFNIPIYAFGSNYEIQIPITDQVSSIEVLVNESDDLDPNNYIIYEVKQNKTSIGVDEKSVFYRIGSDTINISLGSGVYGNYIPQSKVRVNLELTKASKGNIGTVPNENLLITGVTTVENLYDINNNLISSTENVLNNQPQRYISINVAEAIGGTDVLTGELLRSSLISFIQSRNNLINESDYISRVSQVFNYYYTMFKKTTIHDNIIYIYISLKTRDFLIPRTMTIDLDWSVFSSSIVTLLNGTELSIFPTTTINNESFISPFIYHKNSLTGLWEARLYNTFNISYPVSIKKEINDAYTLPLIYIQSQLETDLSGFATGNMQFNITSPNNISDLEITVKYNEPITLNNTVSAAIIQVATIDPLNNTIQSIVQDGIYTSPISIVLEVKKVITTGLEKIYTLIFSNVQVIYDIGNTITLTKFTFTPPATTLIPNPATTTSMLHMPVIHKDTFDADREFYLNQMTYAFSKVNFKENRMISDVPQIRFLNTNTIDSSFVKAITKQEYNFNITLPLKLYIKVLFDNDVIINKNLIIENLLNSIKLLISKELKEKYTTTDLRFYKSYLIDILQTLDYVISVRIELYDNTSPIPNRIRKQVGADAYFYEDEYSVHELDVIMNKLDKVAVLNYNPMLYHWDLNNIEVNYSTESNAN